MSTCHQPYNAKGVVFGLRVIIVIVFLSFGVSYSFDRIVVIISLMFLGFDLDIV
jgi:hypothetical protein